MHHLTEDPVPEALDLRIERPEFEELVHDDWRDVKENEGVLDPALDTP